MLDDDKCQEGGGGGGREGPQSDGLCEGGGEI